MQRFVAFAVILIATVTCRPGRADATPAQPAAREAEAEELVARVNDLRAARGLRPLAIDAELTAKAAAWAERMASEGRIWHSTLSDGINAAWVSLGENVGAATTVSALHQAFANSPRHYENLVADRFGYVGVGIAAADGVLYASEVFMELQPAPTPTVSPPASPTTGLPTPSSAAPAASPVPAPSKATSPAPIPARPQPAASPAGNRRTPAATAPPVDALPEPERPTGQPVRADAGAALPAPADSEATSDELHVSLAVAESASPESNRRVAAVGVMAWMLAAGGFLRVQVRRLASVRRAPGRGISNRELRRIVGRIPGPPAAA